MFSYCGIMSSSPGMSQPSTFFSTHSTRPKNCEDTRSNACCGAPTSNSSSTWQHQSSDLCSMSANARNSAMFQKMVHACLNISISSTPMGRSGPPPSPVGCPPNPPPPPPSPPPPPGPLPPDPPPCCAFSASEGVLCLPKKFWNFLVLKESWMALRAASSLPGPPAPPAPPAPPLPPLNLSKKFPAARMTRLLRCTTGTLQAGFCRAASPSGCLSCPPSMMQAGKVKSAWRLDAAQPDVLYAIRL
mmetsp:Transcript_10657/g.26319  ORF Transcript_10657/g.26319 Transcript_10657/m.26319 type:complete len:245 (+) Transcript_10657:701-1435(+)